MEAPASFRFTNPWWVVVGAVAGLFVCNGPVLTLTFGVFLKPVMADMGWDRGTASFALSIGPFLSALAVPVLGRLMDRWGIRAVALPGILIYAGLLGLVGLSPHSLWVFAILAGLAGAASAIQTPLSYAKAIAAWFDRRRGLALGIAMAGVGLGAIVLPQLSRVLIERYGWRGTYVILAVMTAAIALPAVALWIREPRPGEGERRPGAEHVSGPGLTAREAARTERFWVLGVVFFLVALAINGMTAHVVPLLTDHGLSAAAAAATLGTFGLATLAGRLLAGFLVDRIFAPYIATVFFLAPVAGFGLLATASGGLPVVGVVLMGLGLGTEIDLIAFLVSRYFGHRSFGEIYGYFFMIFGLGTAIGPFLGGLIYQLAGSYDNALIGAGAALVIASICVNRLGEYVYPVEHHPEPPSAAADVIEA
jgi:MFS family permease